ncbi:hypothetical protein [Neobacillus sp. D3-1R]|uniref:hypothetical protein n=1 Tax=Neobacillus sp. D3-1R TaxID=3445778 RepID=UPI003FA11FCF
MKSFFINIFLRFFFYPCPKVRYSKEEEKLFNDMFEEGCKNTDKLIPYTLSLPKYQFLQYLSDTKSIVFHGSNKIIEVFEPREQTLFNGEMTKAVFATKDPIWAMFYATLRKESIVDNIRNGSISANQKQWYHFYSLTQATFSNQPWEKGYIYILSTKTFEAPAKGLIQFNEWVSKKPVSAICKIEVTPSDFYFLNKVACHDPNESISKTWFRYKFRTIFLKKFINDNY